MQYRPLGSSGIEASVVGFGAWAIGGWMWGGVDEAQAIHAIHAAIDTGMNLLDTAPVYGFYKSEELVGRALAGRRDQVVLATKCGLIWDREEGAFHFDTDEDTIFTDRPTKKVYRNLRPASIRAELEGSLQRLKTDRIDLYQTHWQDPSTPIADAMGELLKLKAAGKIRAIGVSNARPEHIDQYRALGPVDTAQEKYSMLDRQLEDAMLPYCHEHGIAVLAYSPLAQGLLTGKITASRQFAPGDQRASKPRFSVENRNRVDTLLAAIAPIAQAHSLTLAQLTIAWTIAQTGLTHALCGARNPQQVQENAQAGQVQLAPQELQTITHAIAQHAGDIPA